MSRSVCARGAADRRRHRLPRSSQPASAASQAQHRLDLERGHEPAHRRVRRCAGANARAGSLRPRIHPLHARIYDRAGCAPSRAAIITGMYQNAIGAQHMRTTEDRVPELPGPYLAVPPFYVKAFPEYLRAAGYYTSNRAKTDYQFGVPFTIWDDLGPDAHWRNRPDRSQPFFSVFNLEVTHESQIFPTSPARKGKPLVTDPARDRGSAVLPRHAARSSGARAHVRQHRRHGRQVGEILGQLEADGLADNTIVFYWSDHGDGVPRSKRSLYDSGLRVPLMIRWPEMSPRHCGQRQRSARQHDRSGADGARAGRCRDSGASSGACARRTEGGAAARIRVRRARSHGHRIRHDALGARRRFLYIRNFAPELPYAGHIIYRNQSAIMQEWLRLQAERALTGPAALWMRTTGRPRSSTTRSPIRIRSAIWLPRGASADARAHAQSGDRLDDAHRRSGPRQRAGDDSADVARRRAARNGAAVHRAAADSTLRSRAASMTIRAPTEVVIYVPTQGASIGYTTEEGPAAKWRLYTGPILVDRPMTLRAKAIRYGYKESAETRTVFTARD